MQESESHRALSPGTETQDITGQVKGKDSHPGAGELGGGYRKHRMYSWLKEEGWDGCLGESRQGARAMRTWEGVVSYRYGKEAFESNLRQVTFQCLPQGLQCIFTTNLCLLSNNSMQSKAVQACHTGVPDSSLSSLIVLLPFHSS